MATGPVARRSGGQTQGAVRKNIVQPGIKECDRLLAFVDLPNANVGFEVGYGLGLGKAVAAGSRSAQPRPLVEPAATAWVPLPVAGNAGRNPC